MSIPIIENLKDGDCGLWFDVLVSQTEITGAIKIIHCVCPYRECIDFKAAIEYYFKHYHKENRKPIHVTHHKYSLSDLKQLAIAC